MRSEWINPHASLLTSSVLPQGPTTVAVYSMILAAADRDGRFTLSIPYCASAMNTSVGDVEAAFNFLASPDPANREGTKDGRRILMETDGSWKLAARAADRDRERRRAAVVRQQRYRERKAQREQAKKKRECQNVGCSNTADYTLPTGLPLCKKCYEKAQRWNR